MGRTKRSFFTGFCVILLLTMSIGFQTTRSRVASSGEAYAEALSTIALSPTVLNVAPGADISLTVTVANVSDLNSWQVPISYNGTVLNLTSAYCPGDNVFANQTGFIPVEPVNGSTVDGYRYVFYGAGLLFGSVNVQGPDPGVLCKINFTVIGYGKSALHIGTNQKPIQFGSHPWETWSSALLNSNLEDISYMTVDSEVLAGPYWSLTVAATNGGMTSPSSGVYWFIDATEISIVANPDLGYGLEHWELDGFDVGKANPYNVTMNADHSLLAIFEVHTPVTWIVDKSGSGNFTAIQEALDSPLVVYDDIILVRPGIYRESVSMSKKVCLIGDNPSNTIIDGNGANVVVTVYGNVSGFTIRNGTFGIAFNEIYSELEPGQPLSSHRRFVGGGVIEENFIIQNTIGGVLLGRQDGSGFQEPWNSLIENNIIVDDGLFGIHVNGVSNCTIINNTVSDNQYGIDFYAGSNNNTLKNNTMVRNKYNFGTIMRGASQGVVSIFHSEFFANDVDASNLVDGKPVYYLVNQNHVRIPSCAGYISLVNCTDIASNSCVLENNIQGVFLFETSNYLIENSVITNNAYGIYLESHSWNNTLMGNTLNDNINGIYLGCLTRYTKMRNNTIAGGTANFGINPQAPYVLYDDQENSSAGVLGSDLMNDIDETNTVDRKPIIYWINQHDRQVPSNAGFVMLVNCTNILVKDLNLTNNLENIIVFASNNTTIGDNLIANSVYGVKVSYFPHQLNPGLFEVIASYGTVISGNIVFNNGVGIMLSSGSNSLVSSNALESNPLGILFGNVDNSTISGNEIIRSVLNESFTDYYFFYYPEKLGERCWEILETKGGIFVTGQNNLVYENVVAESSVGISALVEVYHWRGSDNTIFHNDLMANYYQALETDNPANHWDSGYPSGGNYWSDYNGTDLCSGPYQNQTGSDGIGDTPYFIRGYPISSGSMDSFPLMTPWKGLIGDLNHDGVVDMSDITIAANAFGAVPSDSSWNSIADVTGPNGVPDGKVNMRDIGLIARHFG